MTSDSSDLGRVFDESFSDIAQVLEASKAKLKLHEVGRIESVATGVARVSGLPSVGFEELLQFPGGVFGIAFNLGKQWVFKDIILIDGWIGPAYNFRTLDDPSGEVDIEGADGFGIRLGVALGIVF